MSGVVIRRLVRVLAIAALAAPVFAAGSDPVSANEAGRQQFSKCTACHSLEQGEHRMGPSLAGLLGRRAGTSTGFQYSPAMQQSGIVWTRKSLSTFLESPQATVPGTAMPFGGLRNAQQRAALIEFLTSH